MAKKNKVKKQNEDDVIEEDGMPLSNEESQPSDEDADFDPTQTSDEVEEEEVTGYEMGKLDFADMPADDSEDNKIIEEGLRLANNLERDGEEPDNDSDLGFDDSTDLLEVYDDDGSNYYDNDDY